MTDAQRLFLVQGRSDFAVFRLLQGRRDLPACHALHYLQMATEMLGKAHAWRHGAPSNTHRAFVGFLRGLGSNRRAQRGLGFEGKNEHWENLIRKSLPLAKRVEDLAPALAGDGPNPEYPWPAGIPRIATVEHSFDLWDELQETTAGRQFLDHLVVGLFATAEAFL